MNYKETGFRPFYQHFCVLPITKTTKAALVDFPGAKKANGVLTYGYYDSEDGLTLEVIAAAQIKDGNASFWETSKETRSFIRVGAVAEDDFLFFADEDRSLANRYEDKIEMLHYYDADEEVEKTREMSFLDSCRHENYIDDILVYLCKEGNQPEGCWTRIIGLGDHFFMGILLNEPDQDFGYHVSKMLNYVISVIGLSVVIPLAISFSTAVINMFNSNIKATDHMQLLNNTIADKIVYILVIVLLAIPVWNSKIEKLNS
ncbi:hypothetical protein GMA11_07065 [Granulicatella sp. zg-ZJ]|uniref:hypothetical protein n=1 Tax=Granulicatella sp. zg-ZJ TaxID=2678504 RepID=UPI0013D35021|nr:hypothetical protein [Granulicatella sp. zg-ZJ]NEW62320.1 hypothetical protein [Granulicatella sp. zg-ZJ]NEW63154.1 hypothetical protein [Granulicatella sp. zg-ZJ]